MTLQVLSSGEALRRVLSAYLLYGLVDVAIWLAIILWAYDEGGARLAGLVAVVQLLPAATLAPLLAALGDRVSRGTALVAAHLGVALTTGLTTVALLAQAPAGLVVLASTAATTMLSVVRPLHFAVLPQLVRRPQDLVAANALSSVGDGVALFVGPVLAGLGAHVAGPWLVFSAATATAAAATLLCLRTGVPPPSVVSVEATGWLDAFRGLGSLARDRAVVVLLLVLTTKFVIEGAHDVLGVSFSVDALGMGSSGAGVIVGAMGLGGLLGGFLAAVVAGRRSLAPAVLGSGLVQGVALALVAVLMALAPVVVLLAMAGAGGAVLMVAGRTLLQRTADQRMLARVFAVQEGASLIGLAVGAAAAPFLIELLSARHAFIPLGVGAALVTTLGYLIVRDLDRRAVVRLEEAALLRRVAFLSVLPAYELEQLARNAEWMEIAAGEDVVRQGEPGDLFYVVADGELEVRVDGAMRPARLTTGQGFGEIALLRAEPRTATVTAATPARLLTVAAEDFLAAVTGAPDGHALVAEVAASHLKRDTQLR